MMLMLTLLVGCGQPVHLQYDHGRAYAAAFSAQADRSRATVQDVHYSLTGAEAEAMRKRVVEATTDEETTKVENSQ
jgi:ABC-type glycerol-3-phosphate transport system substrate-binding protein